MPDARYLIRLVNDRGYQPIDQDALLQKARLIAAPLNGKVINLRVTPHALEFDLFCEPNLPLGPFFDAWRPLGDKLTSKRLDVPPPPVDPASIVAEARHLFNEHRYWEVHEVLEGLWKKCSGSEKQLVQGLILAAAALVHVQKNESDVAWSMLADALRRLEKQPENFFGWDIRSFRDALADMLTTRAVSFPTV